MSAVPSLDAPDRRARRRRTPGSQAPGPLASQIGLWVLLACAAVLALAGLFPGLLAPGDPLAVDPAQAFQAPGWSHPFGTDESGRNVFTRVVHGAGPSLSLIHI